MVPHISSAYANVYDKQQPAPATNQAGETMDQRRRRLRRQELIIRVNMRVMRMEIGNMRREVGIAHAFLANNDIGALRRQL